MYEGEKIIERVQSMSTGLLIEFIAGKPPESLDVLIGNYELERRKNKWSEIRSWMTIGISVLALAISIFTLTKKVN